MIRCILKKTLESASGPMLLDIDLSLEKGEFITLYGDSGAGKTSILRMLAGLMKPEEGLIKVNDYIWFDSNNKINLPPQIRRLGFVFQDYALFPNMTVRENMSYALEKGQDKNIIAELIDLIELEDLQHKKPDKLSGGQKQRVALARALVRKPEILLLDEPLSALDLNMRSKLQDYILKAHKTYELTTILISHDVTEVIKMSEKVYVLKDGNIIKKGSPIDVFSNKKVSGKFQFSGELIKKEKEDFVYILTIIIGANVVKVVAEESEAEYLNVGDKVMVASKAFNPVIQKIE